jgi:hypothetical protein
MALTLEAEQRLEKVGLIQLFEDDRERWQLMAKESYDFNAKNFPEGKIVRRDDVAKMLVPLLEIDNDLLDYLGTEKLKQKYWIRDFCDLILDRTWGAIAQPIG